MSKKPKPNSARTVAARKPVRHDGDGQLRRLAAQLDEERQRLIEAQRVAKIGSWETDLITFASTWSLEMHRIFGTDPACFKPTHQAFLECAHPDDRAAIEAAFRRSTEERGPAVIEHRLVLADGRVKQVEERWQVIFDAKHQPLRAIGTCQDITDRKQAEEERDRLFNHSIDLLCVAGFDGWLRQVSPAWTQCLGWTAEELTSRPMMDFVHPDDRAVTQSVREKIQQGVAMRGFENRYRTRDGSYRYLSWNVHPLPDLKQVFAVARDVTARKEIEEASRRSQTLLGIATRMSRLGAWQVEVPSMVMTWSDEVGAIHETPLGFTPTVEGVIGFYAPEFRAGIQQVFEACVERGEPFDVEKQIITAKGRRVWVRVLGEAVRGDTGKIICVQGAFQDISERKQAQEETQRLAIQFTTTLESITDAFLTIDRNWRFTFLNREAERLLLRLREDLIGRNVWEEFPAAVGSTFEREYRRALAESRTVVFEEYYEPLQTWFAVRAYPSDQGLAIYFRDVTESRRADAKLRESEERFRLFARATNDAVWDWNVATNQLWWNEGYVTLFGLPAEGMDPSYEAWVARLHPDDRERVLAVLDQMIDGGGDTFTTEYRFRCANGSYAYVLDRAYVMRDATGRSVRMVGAMTDLTERMRTEEKLREQAALLDQANDAILVRDLNHRVLYWNRSAERLYGWTVAEAVGRSVQDLIYGISSAFAEAMKVVLAKGEWAGQVEQFTKDGRVLTVEGHWTLVCDAQGRPRSILAINSDVTERKKLERQFLRAQRMESIGTLAGGIAHDLNNLLSPIVMGAGLLQRFELPEQGQEVVRNIERSARRGAELVKQVLSFARGVEGERIPLQLAHIIREIASIVGNTFPKNIAFEAQVAPDLWLVPGDATQLNQVLLNLCVNARDAMPDGGRLTIVAGNREIDAQYSATDHTVPPGRYALVEVSDSGSGMTQAVMDRIFEPFFTTKDLGKGTGLGLSTVLGIVRSHGGAVTVQSEPGRGSTFRVWLPAHADQAAAGAAPVATGPALRAGHGEQILVVDDEDAVLMITQQTLEAFGYRVLTATDGAHAVGLYALQQQDIAAVVTDLMMPVMDGPMLIASLQRINPGVRVIAATGLKSSEYMTRAVGLGVRHFLTKPFTAEALLTMVHKVLTEPAPSGGSHASS